MSHVLELASGEGLMAAIARRICDGAAKETKRAAPLARASEAGVVEGYASLFGVVDSGGDVVMAGAFKRTLLKRGAAGVKMLWQHNAAEPIGVWTSIVEDARGLKVIGRLDLSVARAREALSLMRGGAVDGLSIGFRTKRATTETSSGARRLHEVDLWEISIVTFPMLAQARVEKVKRAPISIDAVIVQLARLKQHRAAERFEAKLLSFSLERRYAPDQPRVPAGSPDGGQWTSGGGVSGGGFGGARDDRARRRDVEGRVRTALNSDPKVKPERAPLIQPAQAQIALPAARAAAAAAAFAQAYRNWLNAQRGDDSSSQRPPAPAASTPATPPQDPQDDKPRREGRLSGRRARVRVTDDGETQRGAMRENETADILVRRGYDVEQKPGAFGRKEPDYRINGEIFDCYAPRTDNIRNIWDTISGKLNTGQTPSVVVNLTDSSLSITELRTYLLRHPISGAKHLWVVDRAGNLIFLVGGL